MEENNMSMGQFLRRHNELIQNHNEKVSNNDV